MFLLENLFEAFAFSEKYFSLLSEDKVISDISSRDGSISKNVILRHPRHKSLEQWQAAYDGYWL